MQTVTLSTGTILKIVRRVDDFGASIVIESAEAVGGLRLEWAGACADDLVGGALARHADDQDLYLSVSVSTTRTGITLSYDGREEEVALPTAEDRARLAEAIRAAALEVP